eukprot:Gb_11308 [translate_table: standard]
MGTRNRRAVRPLGNRPAESPRHRRRGPRLDPWEFFEERFESVHGPLTPARYSPFRHVLEDEVMRSNEESMSPRLRQFVRASPAIRWPNAESEEEGLTAAQVERVAKKELYLPPKKGEDDACPICLDRFAAKQQLLRLPCDHRFHADCLMPWISDHSRCPVCRLSLATGPTPSSTPLHTNDRDSLVRAMEDALDLLGISSSLA